LRRISLRWIRRRVGWRVWRCWRHFTKTNKSTKVKINIIKSFHINFNSTNTSKIAISGESSKIEEFFLSFAWSSFKLTINGTSFSITINYEIKFSINIQGKFNSESESQISKKINSTQSVFL
jgi:hypothetical protein